MMLSLALTVSFISSALFAAAVIAVSLHRAVKQIAPLRRALAECPQTRSYRYRVIETVVIMDGGKVLPLPIRQRRPAPAATDELRAAA